MGKKKKRPQKSTLPRARRLHKGKAWLAAYTGTKVVRAYRKRFHVDTTCAIAELITLGHEFDPAYLENLRKAEALRLEQFRQKKEEREYLAKYGNEDQNAEFYFIAGYTPGGAPYGVTWHEMGLEPYEDEFDDEDIIEYRYYEHLHKRVKDKVDDCLREDFSAYVMAHGHLPDKQARIDMIKPIFEGWHGEPLLYTDDFIKRRYRRIVRKRENRFKREGITSEPLAPKGDSENEPILEQ